MNESDPLVISALIVDDEPDMRALIRAAIETANHGLTVSGEAADGNEAIERWRENAPDVIVMDHRMPGRSGMQAAEAILEEHPEQHIILFTAYLTDELEEQAKAIGIGLCMHKDSVMQIPAALWSCAPDR